MTTLQYLANKYFIDLKRESPIEIPGVSRLDLIRWIRELDFKVGAEIGVANGEYAQLICEINHQLKLWGVDSYEKYEGYHDYQRIATFQNMRGQMERRMRNYTIRGRFELIHEYSMAALKYFADDSLDFVYIDANHEAPYVLQDIAEWTKKVRPGGLVAGHDYTRVRRVPYAVIPSVNQYVRENNIQPWFILGSNDMPVGVVREGARSWMFVRP